MKLLWSPAARQGRTTTARTPQPWKTESSPRIALEKVWNTNPLTLHAHQRLVAFRTALRCHYRTKSMQTSLSEQATEKNPAGLLGADIGTGPKKTEPVLRWEEGYVYFPSCHLPERTFGQYRDFGESQTSSLFNLSPQKRGDITFSQKLL